MAQSRTLSLNATSDDRVFWGFLSSVSFHALVIVSILGIAALFHVKSIEELMKESGALALQPPEPAPMEIVLQPDETPPPPTDHPEFIRQIEQPKPVPVVIKKPIIPPKPKPVAVVAQEPAMVSKLEVGSGKFPKPGYPYQALARHEKGVVTLSLTFDSGGYVTDADVVSSSGYPDLDSGARSFIRSHWHDPDFAGRHVSVPINYTF